MMTPSSAAIPEILRQIMLEAMIQTRIELLESLREKPAFYLAHTYVEGTNKAKWMLRCDATAEQTCKALLERKAKQDGIPLQVYGEESLWDIVEDAPIVFTTNDPYVIILDMVDGSDLLEREMGNWCSAAVAFSPKEGRVLVAVIQDSRDNIYIATQQGASLIPVTTTFDSEEKCHIAVGNAVPLKTPHHPFPPGKPRLQDNNFASICFYGQKGQHFIELPPTFLKWLRREAIPPSEGRKAELLFQGRLYTLAGNPMMAKLANGDRVHVVFEHLGQHAHDAVPGLFIAIKAGAILLRLKQGANNKDVVGTIITESELGQALYAPCKPDSLAYVLAATQSLADEMVTALTSVAQGQRETAE